MNIDVGRSDFRRRVARSASIILKNRWFEQNPVLNPTQEFPALIARPRLRRFDTVGDGPIRKVFDEPGTFGEGTFVVSGPDLFKFEITGVSAEIGTISTSGAGDVSMGAVGNIGETPESLFIADGGVLWLYLEDGNALGHLSAAGAIANGDDVEIDGVYYSWTNGSVDTGTPAGTAGNPWLVDLGASNAEALTALFKAINGTGDPGVDYSTVLVAHATVTGYSVAADDLYVAAQQAGAAGNAITTTETGANISWGAATLEDGGDPMLRQIAMPGDVGAISLAVIDSYVIILPVQGQGVNGRFYWIEPGETTVDPLNFATAERSPDAGNQVIVFSDRFWIAGQTSTEAWVMTGNLDAPVQRFAGVLFDRGVWEGTAVKVKESMILVDEDFGVFQIAGGLKRISRPDIEGRIRRAAQIEAATLGV